MLAETREIVERFGQHNRNCEKANDAASDANGSSHSSGFHEDRGYDGSSEEEEDVSSRRNSRSSGGYEQASSR